MGEGGTVELQASVEVRSEISWQLVTPVSPTDVSPSDNSVQARCFCVSLSGSVCSHNFQEVVLDLLSFFTRAGVLIWCFCFWFLCLGASETRCSPGKMSPCNFWPSPQRKSFGTSNFQSRMTPPRPHDYHCGDDRKVSESYSKQFCQRNTQSHVHHSQVMGQVLFASHQGSHCTWKTWKNRSIPGKPGKTGGFGAKTWKNIAKPGKKILTLP